MLHIFVCRLTTPDRIEPTETDDLQISVEWMPIEDVPSVNLLPKEVRAAFTRLIAEDTPQFLGSVYLEHNHG